MKNIKIITATLLFFGLIGCEDYIELENYNSLSAEDLYVTTEQVQIGLNGCYAGMRAPLIDEFALTEVRSDNAFMNARSSSSVDNLILKDLDIFNPATNLDRIYNYWYSSYQNIRNVNLLLESLNVNYNPTSGTITFDEVTFPITDIDRKEISAQASFIRAYHYFNLVRLYGKVFILHEVVAPGTTATINRSELADVYKLIEADLLNASENGIADTYASLPVADRGRVTTWAAKTLLAKVYLTLNRKAEAKILLEDVMAASGHNLLTGTGAYANVFSPTNEMNAEIIFAVRYKSGGLGQGSPFTNFFAPTAGFTVAGIIEGYNAVTVEYANSFESGDIRKETNAILNTASTSNANFRYYSNKHLTSITLEQDSELDWPVLRYSDVLLMFAEADGNTTASLAAINLVHQRAGLSAISATSITSQTAFETVLANERRWEFGAENHRWFDLLRYTNTLTSNGATIVMNEHFEEMRAVYNGTGGSSFNVSLGIPNVDIIKDFVSKRLLLPIPQREIDTNTTITIEQNDGY